MKIFGYELRKAMKDTPEVRSIYDNYDAMFGSMTYGSYSSWQSSKALTLSSVYRSVNLISDAIAGLQMKLYNIDNQGYKSQDYTNPLSLLLGVEPNPLMSRFTFFKLIITSMLMRGNAYILINRDANFNVKSLEFVNPDTVTITNVRTELKYIVAGIKGFINASDIIHILNFPQIGSVYGASTIANAVNTLEISYNSESHAGNWFKGGANAAGFLTFDTPLTPKQEGDLINKFKATANSSTGNPNGISVIGGVPGAKFLTMGISPKDSQLLESRMFNVTDIARFFNVNPILLFDSTKGTYSNVENAQLDFLNTTLLPVIEKIENEFVRKLIMPSQMMRTELRFDVSSLLRMDAASKITYYKGLFDIGVMSPNDVAKDLNLPKVEGQNGDEHFISTNLQQLNNLIVNANNIIDNKLK